MKRFCWSYSNIIIMLEKSFLIMRNIYTYIYIYIYIYIYLFLGAIDLLLSSLLSIRCIIHVCHDCKRIHEILAVSYSSKCYCRWVYHINLIFSEISIWWNEEMHPYYYGFSLDSLCSFQHVLNVLSRHFIYSSTPIKSYMFAKQCACNIGQRPSITTE